MKIVLGSSNQSKKRSVQIALESLNISGFEIECISVPSDVSSKPLNEDILNGARNRNENLLQYLEENNMDFDLIISIEGGYEEINDKYFIVTYASIMDNFHGEYIGKSVGLEITKSMYDWVKNGNSLNKVIELIIKNEDNKKGNGISGYLSDEFYRRDIFDASAIQSALIRMNTISNYNILDEEIRRLIKE